MFTVAIVALAMTVATTGFAASRGASFTPIGLFPLCTPETPPDVFCETFPITTTNAMSDDGSTVVGLHAFYGGGYIWTADTGLNTIGPVYSGVYTGSNASRISTTYADPTLTFEQAGYWTGGYWPNNTEQLIPLTPGFAPCGSSGMSVHGASDDWIVGLTWTDRDLNGNGCEGASGYAWSEGTGTFILDNSISGDGSYRANAVNTDGSVIAGWSAPGRTASAWINGVETYLCAGDQADWFCDEGWAVTPDGSTILFTGASPEDFNTRATTYDVATGTVHQLPFPDAGYDPSWDSFQGWDISADGGTVVGEFGGGGFFGSPPYPVVYVESLDMTIDLQVMLLGQGLDDLYFWFLSTANVVSADGTIIAGYGNNPDGWIEGYQVDISKVKVCHKPEGSGNGNNRTLTIGWDSVGNHLGHGDVLATCEFANSDAAARFADRRMAAAAQGPADDVRVSLDRAMKTRERQTGIKFDGQVTNMYPNGALTEDQQSANNFTPEQRIESLRERVGRHTRR
jgi:hypothetical protein